MIHLIVGNTGSGKTTYSHRLKENVGGVVFSIDKWNKTLFFPDKKPIDGLEWFLDRIDRSEKMILDLIHQLEQLNTDSILDLGFSKFEHRQKFTTYANLYDYEYQIHFLDIPKDIRLKRVMKRNKEKGDTYEFDVSQDNFNFMETWFEKPTFDEMLNGITINVV